jgi:hypothetical protein
MLVLFNEMSYGELHCDLTNEQVVLLLEEFARVLDFVRRVSDRQTPIFHVADAEIWAAHHSFLAGKTIKQCISLLGAEHRTAVMFMLQRLHVLPNDANVFDIEKVSGMGTWALAPYFALEGRHFGAVSLFSNEIWYRPLIEFQAGGTKSSVVNHPKIQFTHVAEYVETVFDFYTQIAHAVVPDNDGFLPRQKLSNGIFVDKGFQAAYKTGSQNDKMANYQIVGSAVAQLNGYLPDTVISKINATSSKKRNIFFNYSLARYVSIDYEKGAFELHDENGKHLGEFNFQGISLDEADDKGRHDISLKR